MDEEQTAVTPETEDAPNAEPTTEAAPAAIKATHPHAVKMLEDGPDAVILGGYGFVWGGKDLWGEHFTKNTDFWFDRLTAYPMVMYQHGQDGALRRYVLGRVTDKVDDGVGLAIKMRIPKEPVIPESKAADVLWVQQQRELHRLYLDSIMELVEDGELGLSSGAVGHLVDVASDGEILSWPTVEFSLTPTPMEPRTLGVSELRMLADTYEPRLKSLLPQGAVTEGDPAGETATRAEAEPPANNHDSSESTTIPESTVEPEPEPETEPEAVKAVPDETTNQGDNEMAEQVTNVAAPEIDYERLAGMIAEKMQPATPQPDPGVVARNQEAAKQVQVVQPGKFKSLGEQLLAVYHASSPERVMDNRLKATGLQEGNPSDGGFLVQHDFAAELLRRTYDTAILGSRVRRIPISANSNGIKINAIDETSRADGSRFGGVQAYWTAEAAQMTGSRPKFRQISLELEKLTGLCYATDELLRDAQALESVILTAFPEEFNFKIDDAILRGTGAGMPQGILNSAALVTVAAEAGQGADTVEPENIVKMWSRMWGRSRSNAVWLINQDVEPQLFTMALNVGTGGVPVYMPANGLSAAPYATLMGRPVIPCEQCGTVGDVGDILLVDLSQYIWIDKGGIDSASSVHVQFLYNETVFRFVYRADGKSAWNDALTPFQSSNELSPFVALAAR
jgi:HK97 family phage major capsid protein